MLNSDTSSSLVSCFGLRVLVFSWCPVFMVWDVGSMVDNLELPGGCFNVILV